MINNRPLKPLELLKDRVEHRNALETHNNRIHSIVEHIKGVDKSVAESLSRLMMNKPSTTIRALEKIPYGMEVIFVITA
jgi:hypothetical protein